MNGLPRVQIITEERELLRSAPAWSDLFARAYEPLVTQSFEWVWCVWKKLMGEGRLQSVLIWRRNQLVLAWPAILMRYHHFWTAEVPLASGGDYIDFLVEKSSDALAFAELAWKSRPRTSDLTLVSRARVSSILHQVITDRKISPIRTQPAHYVDLDQFTGWAAYYRGVSGYRAIERRQRRLQECGNISCKVAETTNEVQSLIEWALRHKTVWLSAKGLSAGAEKSRWVGSKKYAEFLLSVTEELKGHGRMIAFALLLDDRIIATQLCGLSGGRIILLHSAGDQEFRRYSPQNILTVRLLRWAYERRLTADFGFGTEPYKRSFAPENCPVEDYQLPNSPFGKLHELLKGSTKTTLGLLRRIHPHRIPALNDGERAHHHSTGASSSRTDHRGAA